MAGGTELWVVAFDKDQKPQLSRQLSFIETTKFDYLLIWTKLVGYSSLPFPLL